MITSYFSVDMLRSYMNLQKPYINLFTRLHTEYVIVNSLFYLCSAAGHCLLSMSSHSVEDLLDKCDIICGVHKYHFS